MRFHYIASQTDGRIIEGDAEGQGSGEVLALIASKGLRPISIKAVKGMEVRSRAVFGQRITIADKIFLTRYLSLMLKVGTDLLRAIDILLADFSKPVMKALLFEVRTTLEKGQPFHTVFARYPQYFSPVFVSLIRAGEASGNLESVFDRLSRDLEREQELRNKVRGAIAYPAILFGLSMLLLFFLVVFVLPRLSKLFLSSDVDPPTFSKIVFGTGMFLNDHLIFFFGVLALAMVGIWYLAFRSLAARRVFYFFSIRIPVVGVLLKKIALQRCASTLGSLLRAGIPILNALEITADAVGNEEMKNSLHRIAREGITKGLTIGEAFRREAVFPSAFINLIAISEKAGHTEDILDTLSTFYEGEIEASVKTLTTFLEPILLAVMGVMVGAIAVSVIIPVYQFIGQFS